MNLKNWKDLPEKEMERLANSNEVSPYTHEKLLEEIEEEFRKEYGSQQMIGDIFCGFAAGLGPCNAVTVSIISGRGRSKLPKKYLGFPVIKKYERNRPNKSVDTTPASAPR